MDELIERLKKAQDENNLEDIERLEIEIWRKAVYETLKANSGRIADNICTNNTLFKRLIQ